MPDVFFDFSAANDGDGTVAAQAVSPGAPGAFNSLNSHAPADGDVLWLRRGSIVGGLATWPDRLDFNGWPKEGDAHWAGRPQSGIDAGWDADAADFAEQITGTLAFPETISCTKMAVRRFKHDGVATDVPVYFNFSGFDDCRIEHCHWVGRGWDTASDSSAMGAIRLTGRSRTESRCLIRDCTVRCGYSTGDLTGGNIFTHLSRLDIQDSEFHFGKWKTSSNTSGFMTFNYIDDEVALFSSSFTQAVSSSVYKLFTFPSNVTLRYGGCTFTGFPTNSVSSYGFGCGKYAGARIVARGGIGLAHHMMQSFANMAPSHLDLDEDVWPRTSALDCPIRNSTVILRNTDFTGSTATYPVVLSGSRTRMFLLGCLFPDIDRWIEVTGTESQAFSFDHHRDPGTFRGRTKDASILAVSNIRRTGTDYSFCYTRTAFSELANGRFVFGGDVPSEDTILLELPAGESKLVLHLAADEYAGNDLREVELRAYGLDQEGLRTLFADCVLAPTGQIGWEGATGFGTYRLELTVDMAVAGICSAHYRVSAPQSASAALYIDPTPVVEEVQP
jgi:hypothetical protein